MSITFITHGVVGVLSKCVYTLIHVGWEKECLFSLFSNLEEGSWA